MKITIITNTIRRPLDLVVKSVISSLSQDPSVDLVLVDQNETPLVFPATIGGNRKLSHFSVKVPAVSMARNRAVYAADIDWLIFCDDDGYLEGAYFQKFLALIQQFPKIDIFAGAIKRIDTGDFYSKRHSLGGDMKWFWNTKLLMGSNFAIRRSVFEELGKFDESFGAGAVYGSSEETDLAWNAFFHSKKMRYSSELVVFHVPPYTMDTKSEIKKAFRYGAGKSALIRKWLFKGKFLVLIELVEMIALPIIRTPISLLLFRGKEALIQLSSLSGRISGLFIVRGIRR